MRVDVFFNNTYQCTWENPLFIVFNLMAFCYKSKSNKDITIKTKETDYKTATISIREKKYFSSGVSVFRYDFINIPMNYNCFIFQELEALIINHIQNKGGGNDVKN